MSPRKGGKFSELGNNKAKKRQKNNCTPLHTPLDVAYLEISLFLRFVFPVSHFCLVENFARVCLFKEIASLSRTHKKIQNIGERGWRKAVGNEGCTRGNKYLKNYSKVPNGLGDILKVR